MARLSKKLADEKGILSTPNSKPRRIISNSDLNSVNKFYLQDNISRPMPGQNDFIIVSTGQGKEILQKRMMLYTIKEAYEELKHQFPSINVGISKFAMLRPKECVFAGTLECCTHVE